jgi:hypothetical protein
LAWIDDAIRGVLDSAMACGDSRPRLSGRTFLSDKDLVNPVFLVQIQPINHTQNHS